jgi:hypothetical protein
LVLGVLLVSFLASSVQAQQVEQIRENLRVIHAVKHDLSQPLRDVDVSELPPMRREGETSEVYNETPRGLAKKAEGFVDPALQGAGGNQAAPAPIENFDGLGAGDDQEILGSRFAPPDPVIEVGDDYIVESVNIVTAVYDKEGNFVMEPIPNNALWDGFGGVCENQNAGDPIINYDQAEDRWMISQFANVGGPDGMQCVAVSQTSDPSGSYYRYAFPTNGTDYPKMGVGTEAYYLSWRDFDAGGGSMSAAALEKDSMLVGNDADIIAFGPTSGVSTRPPADIDGELPPADTPHPFPALQSDAVEIWGLNPDFQDPGNSTFEVLADLSVDAFDSEVCSAFRGQCVPQPDGGPDLETLSGVIMHRANVRDMGDYMSMVANHTVDVGDQRAGVRWYEFRNDGSGWSVHQQGTFAPDDGLHRWMGSIAINPDGGIALGYSASSSDEHPDIRYTGRPAGAPLGEMTFTEEVMFDSNESQFGSSRWGDYSAMVTDAANPSTFWYVNEYATDNFDTFNWDTRIAAFQFDTDDETPPEAIADLSASTQGPTEVELTWTAPSDPPDGDPAGSYDVRYSTDPIENDTDFENAQQLSDVPVPSDPGTTESASASGLTPDTQYYFAIKSSDVVGNTSDLSNVPTATTDAAPIVGTDPDSLSQTLTVGDSGSDVLAILNEGAGTLDFSLTPEVGGTAIADPLGDLGSEPATADDYPMGKYETSAGAPPENGEPTVEKSQEMVYQPELGETVYYGVNSGADATEFVSFLGNNPEVLNSIGSYPGSGFPNAGDFPSDDDSFVYDLNNNGTLYRLDVETGDSEELGSVGITTDWCGMTTDPNSGTIYAVNCSSGGSTLYELDPDAVEVEEIGELGVGFMIDIAIDGEGQMYGYGISNDLFYEINKETGETTEVGPIGFDANFGQGLTWDTKNQVMLMTAFNNASFQPEFRSVDRQTGSTELIGVLGADTPSGTDQLGWVGTSIDAIPQWATAEPTEGEVESGGSQDVTFSYQTSGFTEGDDLLGGLNYFADVVVESNDPSTPTTNVPVTLTVEGNPAIGFSDDPLAFGQVFSGTSRTDTLGITNESDDAILQVANLEVSGEAFTLVDDSDFVLDPGESMGVPITFSPDDSDTFEGTLSLASSAGDQEVGLSGQGVPFVSIAPDSLSQTIDLTTGDSTATDEFEVTNEFDESLPFEVIIESLEGSNNSVDLTPKLADEELRRWRQIQERTPRSSDVEPSLEPAPNESDGRSAVERFLEAQVNDPVGVTAYGNEVLAPEIVSFDIGEPGEFSVLGEGVDSFAGNFAFANNDQIYWIDNADNNLKTYTLDDGSVETVGELDPVGSEVTWTDMETDPTSGTTYVTSGEGDTNRLYELDVDNAELTPIGTFADTGDLVVAFAIDDQGIGYAHEIFDDEILTVDLETADSEVLGSTGIDANFAQSMTWDGETGQILMAALHDCGFFGCNAGTLRQVNRETGNTTAIGSFPDAGGDEFGWLATPGTGIPWLATNLEQGVLPAGATLTLEAQYDASQQVEGDYSAQVSIVGSELQGEPSEALPVNLTVEAAPILFLSKEELGFEKTFVNDTTDTQLVTLRNDGLADMNINSVSIDSENFAVSPDTAVTLEPGDAQIFEVAFTPQEVGEFDATLSFEGDEVSGEVSLTGEGIPAPELAVDPASFEKQAYVGQQTEYTLDVTNTGEDTLEYNAFSTTGDLLNEDFTGDEFPPEGWFRAGANDGMNWTTPEASACGIWVPNNSACFYWSPTTDGTQRLVTKQINAGGASEVTVAFTHIIDDFSGGYDLRLESTGDGGETWTTVATFPDETIPETQEMIVVDNEDVTSDEFHLAWTFEGDSFSINTWGITDVQVSTPDWLAVSPDSGALTADETLEHTLSVDATDLTEGTLQAAIVANTNDPLAPTATVPFTLNVIEDLAVTPYPTQAEVNPNEEFGVDFNVESLDDLNVFSYELTMEYNPDRMQVQDVVTEGTLSEGLSLSSDIDNGSGTVTIVAADDGEGPETNVPMFDITGEGTLVSLDAQGEPDLGDVTLDLTNMVFNEGEPPATARDSTISIVPLYGDVNLDLGLSTADASLVLDNVAGKTTLIDAQETHADVSGDGDVSAFDASLILRRLMGGIDCFPVAPTCEGSQPALASKSSETSSETGKLAEIFAWGEASRVDASAAKSSGDGTMLSLPLKTDQAVWSASLGEIRAIEVATDIDPDKVSVRGLETQLPDDWQAVHHVSDDGTLKISMAGTTPLNQVGKVATLTLQRKDSEATLEMGGNVTINESSGHELETKSIVSIPDEFALEGTFPNPFRQSATMNIDLPKDASVTVEVYDLLGRKVKTAYNGDLSAGTGRTVRIDGSDLSSGTYFYRARVEMGDNVQTRSGKMTVVR